MRKINWLMPLFLAACSAQPDGPDQNLPVVAGEEPPGAAPAMPVSPPEPAAANVVSEEPFTADSAQGAANVVQAYYALIEAKDYVEAHKLWGPGSDLADGTFAGQFSRYREYDAEVGAPGEIRGAAGSSYVEVPVRVSGVTTEGERFDDSGVVTLRRLNGVDGSTTEQRRWHIAKIALPPH